MTELKTNPALLQALHAAAAKGVTEEEIRLQRVSFVMGSLKPDSNITRARVQDVLNKEQGKHAA